MTNRRRDKRFQEENKVVLHFLHQSHDSVPGMMINALTKDISLGGAKILTTKPLPVDSVLRIQIDLSRTDLGIKLDGRVKWIKPSDGGNRYEIGVEFLHNISKTLLALIRHLYGEDTGIPTSVS
ncbi:MAG: PilZ domain-containing protein [Candidatus Aminicenantes bacterium]|nr:PilZ domain-containing protein [Candidatus Aminicenantes bacterium]